MGNPNLTKDLIKQAIKEWEEQHAYPPEIHFNRHRLPPSGWEYIGPDDHLQVTVFTTAATTGLTLALRSLDAKGHVHYQVENVDTASLSTVVTTRFKMAEGWLIGATVSNIGGGLADQVCFVVLALQRTFKSGTAPHTILQQGYVTNVISVSWPPVFARGPAPSSSGGAMNQIAAQTLSSPAASVTFGSIPQTFNHLLLTVHGAVSDAALFALLGLQFNGDTGNNYDEQDITGASAVVSASAQSAATSIKSGGLPGSTASANVGGSMVVWINGYSGTTKFKTTRSNAERFETLGTTSTYFTQQLSGQWRNTAAITSITLIDQAGGNFMANSSFILYGLN